MKPMIKLSALAGVLVVILSVAVWNVHGGGWAVVTVEDWPEYVEAGEPFTLEYSVRQHGFHLTTSPDPQVVATNGTATVRVAATAAKKLGFYRATLILPQPGEWTLRVRGWQESTLLPLQVVRPGSMAPLAVPAAERGRQLFVAKGCIGCHAHSATETDVLYRAGPDLTFKSYTSAYLRQVLLDPGNTLQFDLWTMPDLGLDEDEVQALVAFTNNPEQTTRGKKVGQTVRLDAD